MILVAIVGADGAGKTTVSRRLVDRLNALGYRARRVDRWDIVDNADYPSASFLQSDIAHIRKCVADMPMHARYLFLLWSMSLALSANRSHEPNTEIIVMDGYWMKHAASEVAYGLSPEWVIAVSSALPAPQIVLRLALAPEQAWDRKGTDIVPYECGMDPSCSMDCFLTHQRRIVRMLDQWSGMFGWAEIDASTSLSQVVDEAARHVLSSSVSSVT